MHVSSVCCVWCSMRLCFCKAAVSPEAQLSEVRMRPKVRATTGRWTRGTRTLTHTHTFFLKFVSASLVSRFHMCLFPYSLSLGAVIEHGYFALTLHKLQHLPPDGQSFSFCVCVCSCVGPCWLPTLDVMYWTVLAATITLYVTSKDVSQLIPFQYGS